MTNKGPKSVLNAADSKFIVSVFFSVLAAFEILTNNKRPRGLMTDIHCVGCPVPRDEWFICFRIA
jgi:hypothetical protein